MDAMTPFGISPFFSSTETYATWEANAFVSDSASESSFMSCLTSVADAVFGPIYDFLKSDFAKTELIKEYIEEHNLYTNPHPLKVSDQIEKIDPDFYSQKELPTRTDLLLALNHVTDRIDTSERRTKPDEKRFKDLLSGLRAIKTVLMASKDDIVSPEDFAQLSLHLEALHLTDQVKHGPFYKEIELLYRETTRASFELKKHIASRVMVDALKEQMTIGFYKADKDKVSKGFSWSCWIFEIGATAEAEKLQIRTNDDEGTPALSEQKAVTISGRTDIGIKGLATGYIDGRIRHCRGKYKEGNTIEHFVEKNFSKLMQEKEFRDSPVIAACASNVSFLKYASGRDDNFFVRATTRNQSGLLNDNKEVMGDFKVSRRAWTHQIANIKTDQARQAAVNGLVESIPPTPPKPSPPIFGFHGQVKRTSGTVTGGFHLGNDAVGSLDKNWVGTVESTEVSAKAMKTNFCSFLTHQYIDSDARNLFKQELGERTNELVENELALDFQHEWKTNAPKDRLALLKDRFENYANLQVNFSFDKSSSNDGRLREFGRIFGLPTSAGPKHDWLAANIMHRMAVLNASLMLEPVARLEEEKKKLDEAVKKLNELNALLDGGSEHHHELISEINETEMLIVGIRQRIKNINTELDQYKDFEKLLLDPPFATDSKFMKRHCYRHRKLTLEWTIYETKGTVTNTQPLGLASFAISVIYQSYFKKHNNPVRIGHYKDKITTKSVESTELCNVAPGVLGQIGMWWKSMGEWASEMGEKVGFGGLVLKTEQAEKTLERHFVMEGVNLLDGEEGPRLLTRKLDANTFTAGVKGAGHVGMGFKVAAGVEHSEEITTVEKDILDGESFVQFTMLELNDYDKEYIDGEGKVKTEFDKKIIDSSGEEKVLKNLTCWRNRMLETQKMGYHQLFKNYQIQRQHEKQLIDQGKQDTHVRDEYLCREMNVFVRNVENSEQSEEAKQKFRVRLKEFEAATSNYDVTLCSNAHLALGECLNAHDEIKNAYQEIVVQKLEEKLKRLNNELEEFPRDRRRILAERKNCEKALQDISKKFEAFDNAMLNYNGHDFKVIIDALDALRLAYESGSSELVGQNERSGLGSILNKLHKFSEKLTNFKKAAKKYDDQLSQTCDIFYSLLNALQPHLKEKKLNSRCYEPVSMPGFRKKRESVKVERWAQPEWDEHISTAHKLHELYQPLM